jgi:hypothetical protein
MVAMPSLLVTVAAGAPGIITLSTARNSSPVPRPTAHPEPPERLWRRPVGKLPLLPLLVLGGLGAVAFAVENSRPPAPH